MTGRDGFGDGFGDGLNTVVDDLVTGMTGYKEKFLSQEECGLKSEKSEQGESVVEKVSAPTRHTRHHTVRHALQPVTRPVTSRHQTRHQVTA
jgi:hypothetical protein